MYAVKNLNKRYGGVAALDDVSFEIRPGEVHALLGANGAGKSTLIKILVGATRPDLGHLTLDDEQVSFSSPRDAAERGIAIVSQELTLFPHLSVLQNLFLGKEPLKAGVAIDWQAMRRSAAPVLEAVGLAVELGRLVGTLRLGEQQLVEIARALLENPRILILDEPTSALQAAETQRLLDVVRTLRDRGVGVVYVSHFLDDVFAIADRVTILRSGSVVMAGQPREATTLQEVVHVMLGDTTTIDRGPQSDAAFEDAVRAVGPLLLEGVGVKGVLEPMWLEAAPGEVVGLAGLEGSGQGAVLDVVFGRQRLSAGRVTLPGGGRLPRTMNQAVEAGVAYIPADRKRLGLMLDVSIEENIATVKGGTLRRMGLVLRQRMLRHRALYWRETLNIVMSSTTQPVGSLSGGNQQKVVFAKWLEADPSVILLDDPSRGVDVSAKKEMHAVIAQMAASSKVVLYTSSDLGEMATVCDRVVIFFGGRVIGELVGDELTESRLMEAINVGAIPESRDQSPTGFSA